MLSISLLVVLLLSDEDDSSADTLGSMIPFRRERFTVRHYNIITTNPRSLRSSFPEMLKGGRRISFI
jgi:hypothetical protein